MFQLYRDPFPPEPGEVIFLKLLRKLAKSVRETLPTEKLVDWGISEWWWLAGAAMLLFIFLAYHYYGNVRGDRDD